MLTPIDTLSTRINALKGRDTPIKIINKHYILQHPIKPPWPINIDTLIVGMGCFWGAEKSYWSLKGVYSTAVGYSAGFTPNPTYQEVCSGQTGHNEVVLVAFDPNIISSKTILQHFWHNHNPTQGMQQGNDKGTQYRSGIYYNNESQKQQALVTKKDFQIKLDQQGYGSITTEIIRATTFYYAEDYHQQYLAKNPKGYCGLGGLNFDKS